jgi:hypothetical protein
MLKPEGFFSFVGGTAEECGVPGCGAGGTRVGTGVGAGAVEGPPFRSVCFFPFTPASPLG